MFMTSLFCRLPAVLLIFGSVTAQVAQLPTTRLGERVQNLRFIDTRFLSRSLDDFKNAKAIVIFVTSRTCPVVQRYMPRLSLMEKAYRSKGVCFLGLNPVPGESVIDVAAHAVSFEMEFPFGKDFDGIAVRLLGADRLAQVVVLDEKHRLVYRGRIDSQHRLGG